jgi:GTP-binding protein LepA
MLIRNFTIVGHINHGKTTLTDRLLELTQTIPDRQRRELFMDQMDLERERGITIKAKAIRMEWQGYVFNLIDTPGHVDFSYEVSRALRACEGAILIVDASQGIQAQTVAHFSRCAKLGLVMIPVINKIDLAGAQTEATAEALRGTFGFDRDEIIRLSAKTGAGVESLLQAVVARIPPPRGKADRPFQALVFDSRFDPHRGVIAVTRVFNGAAQVGEPIYLLGSRTAARVLEVGYFTSEASRTAALAAGEVGYIVTDLKEIGKCRVGETIAAGRRRSGDQAEALAPYQVPPPVVFADFYPIEPKEFTRLTEALERLALTDASLQFKPVESPSLGRGYRGGFLGRLHVEIVAERVRREFDLELLVTEPRVELRLPQAGLGDNLAVKKPGDLPFDRGEVEEPLAEVTFYSPENYLGVITKLVEQRGGEFVRLQQLGGGAGLSQLILVYRLPLREVIRGFYDELKSATSGYASFDYELSGWQKLKVVRLTVLINHREVESLSRIVPEAEAETEARRLAERLKEVIPPHQFAVPIQAAIGRKVIARQTVAARRKDVTAPLYGGDVTRKRKLLEKQRRGKKRLKRFGRVELPREAFWQL